MAEPSLHKYSFHILTCGSPGLKLNIFILHSLQVTKKGNTIAKHIGCLTIVDNVLL